MNPASFLSAIRSLVERPWVAPTVDFLADAVVGSSSHGFSHLLRVLRNAARIRDGESERGRQVDWEVVAAAVLVHDVVDVAKDDPDRRLASTRSANRAVAHFAKINAFGKPRRDQIHHAVRAHSFSADIRAETIEAKILTDADRLEALGAFGIARTFHVGGQLGSSICQMPDPFADQRPLDDQRYVVDHFYTKLLKLRDRLYTPTGRDIAADRHEFMVHFLDQLGREVDRRANMVQLSGPACDH